MKEYSAKEERRLAALLSENGDSDIMVREIVRALFVICRAYAPNRAYCLRHDKNVTVHAERRMGLAIADCVRRGVKLNFDEFQIEPWFQRETLNG